VALPPLRQQKFESRLSFLSQFLRNLLIVVCLRLPTTKATKAFEIPISNTLCQIERLKSIASDEDLLPHAHSRARNTKRATRDSAKTKTRILCGEVSICRSLTHSFPSP
jgi:hypothetical protein